MSPNTPDTLARAAVGVLETPLPSAKVQLTRRYAAMWRCGAIGRVGQAIPPKRPARPARPALVRPAEVPRRRVTRGRRGRVALLHALAHIELNAIDLAWDVSVRFIAEGPPRGFFDDWVQVADEEAKHHDLLARRLADFGAAYGDLPAHDGLWQAAMDTENDLAARLAVVPLVLEARGLDVMPAMIARLQAVDDDGSAAILETIQTDEIGHVAIGRRWFDWLCARRGMEPVQTYQGLVRRHFNGTLKRPFNDLARRKAGLPPDFYEPLAAG